MPLVSVVLPYRDNGAFVERAVASVLDEGVDLEVIAVDDGSRDDGPAKVARMAARDPRIVPVATGGAGLVAALNAGIARARGRFFARMDGDDVSLPGRLAAQAAALEGDERLAVVGARVECFPAGAVGAGLRRYVAWQNEIVTPADHDRELFVESPLCHPSVMLRREAVVAAGGYRDGPFPEDYDLWLRLWSAGWRLAKVPQVLLRWRQREGRLTFTDPRYSFEGFRRAKAPVLAARLRALGRPVVVWGAGPTGKRLARALEPHGVRAEAFVDIDPDKVGRPARGAPIWAPDALRPGAHTVVAAVGARGARELIRARLRDMGFVEGDGFLCAA